MNTRAAQAEEVCPISWAGQLLHLSVEVERADSEAKQRAETEARYRARMIENNAAHMEVRQAQADRRVLAMLREQPGPISTADLASKLGQDRGAVRYALVRLAELGKVANAGTHKRQLWISTEAG